MFDHVPNHHPMMLGCVLIRGRALEWSWLGSDLERLINATKEQQFTTGACILPFEMFKSHHLVGW